MNGASTNAAADWRSGKGHRDENFPVASFLIHPRHRALILAFYNFVRTADDVADHATLPAADKLAYLDLLEAELTGKGDSQKEAVALRTALAERGLPPRHALDLLTAFRMDVTKLRYEDWDDLIHYCRYSAMPVGRFVLDVHGEATSTWAANDALCAALQINNHLQDCGKDFRNLNRVYLPRDALEAAGASVEMLGADKSSPQLLQCLHALTFAATHLGAMHFMAQAVPAGRGATAQGDFTAVQGIVSAGAMSLSGVLVAHAGSLAYAAMAAAAGLGTVLAAAAFVWGNPIDVRD